MSRGQEGATIPERPERPAGQGEKLAKMIDSPNENLMENSSFRFVFSFCGAPHGDYEDPHGLRVALLLQHFLVISTASVRYNLDADNDRISLCKSKSKLFLQK